MKSTWIKLTFFLLIFGIIHGNDDNDVSTALKINPQK